MAGGQIFILHARIVRTGSPSQGLRVRPNQYGAQAVSQSTPRPDLLTFHNAEKAALPFSEAEYLQRLSGLRATMAELDITAVLLTSMHCIAYYSGFLYCYPMIFSPQESVKCLLFLFLRYLPVTIGCYRRVPSNENA